MDLGKARCLLGTTRPTAVNLAWALDKVLILLLHIFTSVINIVIKVSESEDMEEAAAKIHSDDVHLCRRLGQVRNYCDHFD